MSVGDLSVFSGVSKQAEGDTAAPAIIHGQVRRAPTALTDPIFVNLYGYSQAWPTEVRPGRWWPHPDGTLPAEGDPCLAITDLRLNDPWVLVGTP